MASSLRRASRDALHRIVRNLLSVESTGSCASWRGKTRVRIAAVAIAAATVVAVVSTSVSAGPAPSFGGAYVGLNAGAAWGSSGYATDPGCPPSATLAPFCGAAPDPSSANGTAVATSGTSTLSSTRFTGGAQAAYTQTMHVDADVSANLARVGLNYRY